MLYSLLQTARSSTEFSSMPSERLSYELPNMAGDGRWSLDTILGPRRSMDPRLSSDADPGAMVQHMLQTRPEYK